MDKIIPKIIIYLVIAIGSFLVFNELYSENKNEENKILNTEIKKWGLQYRQVLQKHDSILAINTIFLDSLKKREKVIYIKIDSQIEKLKHEKEYIHNASDSVFSLINDSILRANGFN